MFFQMMMKSIRRRKRELRYVSAVTFIAVLFLTSVSVFQNTMDQYVTVTNYENYGEWILSSVEEGCDIPQSGASVFFKNRNLQDRTGNTGCGRGRQQFEHWDTG